MDNRLAVSVVGLVVGLISAVLLLSFASLVYAGDLAPFLPLGSALILLGVALMNLVAARSSSMPGTVMVSQDTTTALVAATLAGVTASVVATQRLGTALAVLIVGSVLTGVVMLVLGWRKAGNLVRYVPVPVMGGFLAGTGWLLLVGATELTTNGFDWSPVAVANLVAALGIGLALTLAMRAGRNAVAILPAVVFGTVIGFYLLLLIFDVSIERARELGLLPVLPEALTWSTVSSVSVDWGAVASALPQLMVIPVVASLGMLLNVGGLELLVKRDANLDRELRTAGWSNLAGALTAAPAAYPTLSLSALGFRLGLHSRAVPLIAAGVCALAAVTGPRLVSFVPTALVGGALLMVGFGFLSDWLVSTRKRMPLAEYLLIWAIVFVIAVFGFVPGVLFGMAAAIVLFTVKYSRLDPIRHMFVGWERTSTIDRSPAEQEILTRAGAKLLVAELQGFLFFGTAHKAVAAVERQIEGGDLSLLVLDFQRVDGFDATAVSSFNRLRQIVAEAGAELVVSGTDPALATAFAEMESGCAVTFVPDIDRALEWCEERILVDAGKVPSVQVDVMADRVWQKLIAHMERIELDEGSVLVDQGDDSNSIYLVELGRVAIERRVDDARWQRVRSVGPGNLIGEIAFYLGAGRTARLRAERPTVVLRLSPQGIARLEEADPSTAIAFHRAVAQTMALRLTSTNEFVSALLR